MTRDEILTMKPGRELDVLIAEKVMGWDVHSKFIGKFNPDYDLECSYVIDESPDDCPEELKAVTGQIIIRRVPNFSTDISAAFEILDKFDGYEIKREPYTRRTEVRIYQFSNMKIHRAVGESVPDVACKAALLAVMEGEKDD